MHCVSYGRHRVSRQRLVSYASHLVSRQSQMSSKRHLISRRAQYARQEDVCLTCRMDAIKFRDRHQCRMGTIWFLRRAQYAQRLGVVSYGRHRVSLSLTYVHSTHVAKSYVFERAQWDVWMPSCFATCKILTTLEPMRDTAIEFRDKT